MYFLFFVKCPARVGNNKSFWAKKGPRLLPRAFLVRKLILVQGVAG